MTKKFYLSTPMNGRTEEEIQRAINAGIAWCLDKGYSYHNPWKPENAGYDESGKVRDKKPLAMFLKSVQGMEDCNGLLMIGEIGYIRGCFLEYRIAKEYGLEVVAI